MRTFLGLPEGVRVRDSAVTNTAVDASSCVSACTLGSDRYIRICSANTMFPLLHAERVVLLCLVTLR